MKKRLVMVVVLGVVLMLFAGCDQTEKAPVVDGDADASSDGDLDMDATDGDVSESDDDADAENEIRMDGDADERAEDEGDAETAVTCVDEIAERQLDVNADETFDIGPFLMQAMPDSIVIVWRTLTESNGEVLLGEGAEPDRTIEHEGTATIHKVRVDGLEPNTRYAYRVRSGEITSAQHHFYTAPEAGQGFTFALWGDNQNGPDNFETVLAAIESETPYILLGVGDHVQNGSNANLWKEQLFGPARALFHETAFYPAIGNHEENAQTLYDLYALPGEENALDETMYSYTYGNAFFLVINTEKMFFPFGEVETELSQWVREQVASPEAQNATWRIAYGHQPGYSEAWGNGSCTYDGYLPVRDWLLPLLAENEFHAYFSGHMHGYERGYVEGGLVHIISGGGGGGLDAWCLDWPETSVAHYEHHFIKAEVGCDSLRFEAVYPDGTRFDWVELSTENWGEIVEQGPMDDLPEPVVNDDSPTLNE